MSADLLENWKDHCPFCSAGIPTGTSGDRCSTCRRSIQQLNVEGTTHWVPKKLGDFELVEYIGRGGMGVVFKGRSSEGDPVAVKIAFGNFTRQLDNELNILQQASQLKTPHIASLRGKGTETIDSKSLRWVATRWIGVRNLSDIILDDTVGRNDRLRILEGIARGIHYLHENKIVHGDICPANIMLTDDNEPYLGDFGVSRFLGEADKMTVLVSSPTGGQPRYGDPEIWNAENGKEPDALSDIYSFGKVALEFLTKNKNLSQAKFSDVHPPLEKNLRETLKSCCQADPRNRPKDMRSVCMAFGRHETASPLLIVVPCLLALILGYFLGNMVPLLSKSPPPPPAPVVQPDPQPPVDPVPEVAVELPPPAPPTPPPLPPPLPPPPPPDWLKFVQVKKDGNWIVPGDTDKLTEFSQWKVDGTVDQFIDRDLTRLIDDIKRHLVHLELSACNDITSKGFAKLADVRGMTDLTIRNCVHFDDKAVEALFPKIEPSDVPNSPLGAVGDLLGALPLSPIKRLDVIHCPVSDVSLEYLPTTLERLRLDECTGITDAGLKAIPFRYKNLRHFSLKKTGVTFAGIPGLFGLAWSSNLTTGGMYANVVQPDPAADPPLSQLRKLEIDGCSMKGYRGDFGAKLKNGLKKFRENVDVSGIDR